jgi:hypothetical protein
VNCSFDLRTRLSAFGWSVQDLHATDAVYHQKCSVNFRTGKSLPSPTPNIKKTTGRPPKHDIQIAFQKTMDYLIEHEEDEDPVQTESLIEH